MSAAEDWLANEKFDFEVVDSPALVNESAGDTLLESSNLDDEEVFFGPQTHKERCIATVVKEKEEEDKIPEQLNPEQQALVLRESALVSLRIKHRNTPNSSKSSPIAIVHPMKREEPDKPIIKPTKKTSVSNEQNKENIVAIKPKENASRKNIMTPKKYPLKSKLLALQQTNINSKIRPSSQPDFAQSKLPMARVRGKSNLEMSQELVDQASLYGLSTDVTTSKSVKRRSGLPMAKKAATDSQNLNTKPTLLPQSAVPSARTKLGSNATEVKETGVRGKPMKALPQSQLRLPGRRKSLLSQGTPNKTTAKKDKSVRRVSSMNKIPSSSNMNPLEKPLEPKNSNLKFTANSKNLATPVNRTPSRKIVARKLPTKDPLVPTNKEPMKKSPANDLSMNSPKNDVRTETQLDGYEITCSIEATSNRLGSDSSVDSFRGDDERLPTSIAEGNSKTQPVTVFKSELSSQIEKTSTTVEEQIKTVIDEAPLLDLGFDDAPKQSPLKGVDLFMDPFQTGHTPPPLIDIGDVLQPEKPKEVLLIEF